MPNLKGSLDAGASASVLPIFNTASQVGYDAVVASLACFPLIRDAVLGIAPDNPLISLPIATGALDTLPHNDTVITLLAICKLPHRQACLDVFIVAVLFRLVALLVVVGLGPMFGSF